MVKKCLIFIGLLFSFCFFFSPHVHADGTLTGSTAAFGTVSVSMPITDIQVSGSTAASLPVKLFVTSGSLSMSTTTGLTFDGTNAGSVIYFSGSPTNINNALATLTYLRPSTGTDTLEISLVNRGEVFFSGNNHLYKFITGDIDANTARTAATSQTAYGTTGYLATITSQSENDFVAARLQGDGWIGASDVAVEGDWKWITGPESGTSFWSGAEFGHTVGGNYANWASGEPNDYNTGEDCAQFYISNSKWNDLPCSGSNLSGYVAEFGSGATLPSITAKNVAITTSTNPTISTVVPTYGSTGITVSTNLTINFSKVVNKNTGNILIKKTSDNTTVETIDVAGSRVTGGGTSTITIDPSVTLAEGTGYYIIIPSTAFKDTSNNFYGGISDSVTWTFTTGDFTAAVLSNITAASVANTSATISWDSNEIASTKLSYGLTSSYGTTTSETNTSPRVLAHTVSLSGLIACTTYHYAAVSIDGGSNTTTSSDKTFTTTGCSANATPSSTTSNSVTASSGGTTTLTDSNTQLTVNAPSNFTTGVSSVVIQIKAQSSDDVLATLGTPASVPNGVGDIVFDVKAIINSTTILDSFNAAITITYQYTDADVAGLDESSFWLYHYHNGAWEALDSCTVTPSTNSISCTTTGFSVFGLFGRQQSGTSNNNNSKPTPYCNVTKPSGSPDLFQIDVKNNQAKLYFSPLRNNVSNYFIAYGYTSGDERFGTFTGQGPSSGVLSYTVNSLVPNTTYYFKVRSQNDCMPGSWGNEMKITTPKTNGTMTYYKNFISKLLSVFPQTTTSMGATKVKKTIKSCEYTVQSGDTLWRIAKAKLKSGTRYTEIMTENNLSSSALQVGQVIKIACN